MYIDYLIRYRRGREQIEHHLSTSPLCLNLYFREYHVSKLDAILQKMFRCISCGETGNFQLKRHLEAKNSCFQYYSTKFNITEWSELKQKLINLTRSSNSSRRSLQRRIENEASRRRRIDSKTVTNSLNAFRQEVSLANYRFCIQCHQSFLNSGAFEITSQDPMYEEYDLENRSEWKRMNKFWCCHVCKSGGKTNIALSEPMLKMAVINGKEIFYPGANSGEDYLPLSMNSIVMFPSKITKDAPSGKSAVINIYSNPNPSNDLISTMYKNRQIKFNQRKVHCDFYQGEISTNQQRRLYSVSKVIDTSMIKGSSASIRKKRNTFLSQFTQHGQAAVGISIHLDAQNLETFVTAHLCQGTVVTLEMISDINEEYVTHYYKHNHTNSETCDNNCIKTELTQVDGLLAAKYIPIYLCSLSQKQGSFVENFIKNSNFDLYSEHYSFGIDFDLNGSGRIYGLAWTEKCCHFNEARCELE